MTIELDAKKIEYYLKSAFLPIFWFLLAACGSTGASENSCTPTGQIHFSAVRSTGDIIFTTCGESPTFDVDRFVTTLGLPPGSVVIEPTIRTVGNEIRVKEGDVDPSTIEFSIRQSDGTVVNVNTNPEELAKLLTLSQIDAIDPVEPLAPVPIDPIEPQPQPVIQPTVPPHIPTLAPRIPEPTVDNNPPTNAKKIGLEPIDIENPGIWGTIQVIGGALGSLVLIGGAYWIILKLGDDSESPFFAGGIHVDFRGRGDSLGLNSPVSSGGPLGREYDGRIGTLSQAESLKEIEKLVLDAEQYALSRLRSMAHERSLARRSAANGVDDLTEENLKVWFLDHQDSLKREIRAMFDPMIKGSTQFNPADDTLFKHHPSVKKLARNALNAALENAAATLKEHGMPTQAPTNKAAREESYARNRLHAMADYARDLARQEEEKRYMSQFGKNRSKGEVIDGKATDIE